MVDLVKIVGKCVYTDTLIMSDGFDIKHNAILKLVLKYEERLKTKGTLSREIQKSAGRPTTFYLLNENQAIFLASLMRNSEKVVDFKDMLSNDFVKHKDILNQIASNQQNAEWLNKRKLGKQSRLIETDEIKRFVEYAEKSGSKNAKRYYGLITTAENKALFFLEQKFKNVRDVLQGHQLETMSNADRIVSKQLKKCVDENIDYHKGYYMAKEAVETFAGLIGKTLVPMLEQKQIGD